jgi:hypothetical protein
MLSYLSNPEICDKLHALSDTDGAIVVQSVQPVPHGELERHGKHGLHKGRVMVCLGSSLESTTVPYGPWVTWINVKLDIDVFSLDTQRRADLENDVD